MIMLFMCPTCKGQTTVSKPPWIAGDQSEWISYNAFECYPCPSCAGKGIIWKEIDNKKETYLGQLFIEGEWEASPDY